MSRQKHRPCQAKYHVPECNVLGTTRDHITPKSIARELGWEDEEIGSKDNIQYLSSACHAAKDATTPLRLAVLRAQKDGLKLSFEEHVEIFRNPENPLRQSLLENTVAMEITLKKTSNKNPPKIKACFFYFYYLYNLFKFFFR